MAVLVESALRALVVALTVWAGLRLFRVTNVPAQKAAWGLVLLCAAAMPVAVRWQVMPAAMALRLPVAPRLAALKAGLKSLPVYGAASMSWYAQQLADLSISEPAADTAVSLPPAQPVESTIEIRAKQPGSVKAASISSLRFDLPKPAAVTHRIEMAQPSVTVIDVPSLRVEPAPTAAFSKIGAWIAALELPRAATLVLALYLAVFAVLIIRLGYGLNQALELWQRAEVFVPYPRDDPGFGLRMRFSRAVASPVTIGSGVLLPYECLYWDAEKLRMVLAHERAHVRQGDFYLQLLAGVYTAVFWFSPLGWWLKGKLSDLGEVISDHAGLEEASSRTLYAQVLLEFAALPRPTVTGVAMARSRNLSNRIERLLNESSFRQSFAGTRRRVLMTVLLVPVALLAGTAMVRVEAASGRAGIQLTAAAQQAPPAAPAAVPGVAPAPAAPDVVDAQTAPAPMAPVAPEAPMSAPSPEAVPAVAPVAVIEADPAIAPVPPVPAIRTDMRIESDYKTSAAIYAQDAATDRTEVRVGGRRVLRTSSGRGNSYSYSSDGDSWALITDPGGRVTFSGEWNDGTRATIDKARKLAGGKFLWFNRDGKSYFINDPAVVSQIETLERPIQELGRKQEELGKQQEVLGQQQEELGRKQEQASVPTPDISKEMAELNAMVAKLNAKKGGTVNSEELSDLEEKIGDIQGRLGELEGKVGERQGEFGDQQGKLGEQQGKLGEAQGKLGEQQGKMSEEADRVVRSIIDQSLHNGNAKPLE